MGTRCDFYQGRGETARYLGSIGHDAYVDAMAERFAGVTDFASFEACLATVFKEYGEISAKNGWPWPWRTSATTDTVVAFDEGRCWTAHPSDRWAPLDDFENPTDEPCVFADMLRDMESTPQGRLSQRLRYGTEMRMGPPEAIMATLLCHVGTLLSHMLLHGFWRDGAFHVLESFVYMGRHPLELKMAAAAVNKSAEDFELLLAECQDCMPELPWELLTWLRERHGQLETEQVRLTLGPDVPVYFGLPMVPREYGRELPYLKFTDGQFDRMHALWQKLLDEAPIVYAQPMATAMIDHDLLPVNRAEAVDWLSADRAEFGGKSLVKACSTAEGRELVRAWAGARLLED